LELASKRLRLNPVDTVKFLHEKLQFQLGENALSAFARNQQSQLRINKIWKAAQRRMFTPDAVEQNALRLAGLKPDRMSPDRLLNGPASLFGVMNVKLLSAYFSIRAAKKDNGLLLIPCYKNPKQIAYFVFMLHDKELTPSKSLITASLGFSGLQLLDRFQASYVVVTSMMRNALQLQNYNFQSSNVPLPILSWKPVASAVPRQQWAALDGRLPVMWERYPTPLVLHQAMLSGARLSLVGPSRLKTDVKVTPAEDWKKWLRHDPPAEIVRRIEANSLPYEQALSNWLKKASAAEKTQLIVDADRFSYEVSKLVRKHIGPAFKSNTSRRVNVPTLGKGGKRGTHGHVVVVEKDCKWYSFSGVMKLPGIVRIEYVVVRPGCKKEYIGKLITSKKEIPFRATDKESTLLWLRDLGEKNGVAMTVPAERNSWDSKNTDNFDPFDAACRFQEPKMIIGLTRIGWDGAGFQFTRTRILNGVFTQTPEHSFADGTPGPSNSFYKLDEAQEELSKVGPEMEIVWAVAIAVCAQITAEAADRTSYGVGINRYDYDVFLYQLLEKLAITSGNVLEWNHNWPRWLRSLFTAVRQSPNNYFVALNRDSEYKEVVTVDADDKGLSPRLLSNGIGKIIPSYLKHFTAREKIPYRKHYRGWVEFTCKEFENVFYFADQTTLLNGYKRLKVS
jgi:hypothetical protein